MVGDGNTNVICVSPYARTCVTTSPVKVVVGVHPVLNAVPVHSGIEVVPFQPDEGSTKIDVRTSEVEFERLVNIGGTVSDDVGLERRLPDVCESEDPERDEGRGRLDELSAGRLALLDKPLLEGALLDDPLLSRLLPGPLVGVIVERLMVRPALGVELIPEDCNMVDPRKCEELNTLDELRAERLLLGRLLPGRVLLGSLIVTGVRLVPLILALIIELVPGGGETDGPDSVAEMVLVRITVTLEVENKVDSTVDVIGEPDNADETIVDDEADVSVLVTTAVDPYMELGVFVALGDGITIDEGIELIAVEPGKVATLVDGPFKVRDGDPDTVASGMDSDVVGDTGLLTELKGAVEGVGSEGGCPMALVELGTSPLDNLEVPVGETGNARFVVTNRVLRPVDNGAVGTPGEVVIRVELKSSVNLGRLVEDGECANGGAWIEEMGTVFVDNLDKIVRPPSIVVVTIITGGPNGLEGTMGGTITEETGTTLVVIVEAVGWLLGGVVVATEVVRIEPLRAVDIAVLGPLAEVCPGMFVELAGGATIELGPRDKVNVDPSGNDVIGKELGMTTGGGGGPTGVVELEKTGEGSPGIGTVVTPGGGGDGTAPVVTVEVRSGVVMVKIPELPGLKVAAGGPPVVGLNGDGSTVASNVLVTKLLNLFGGAWLFSHCVVPSTTE
ncbi:hypothetical protein P154DRAFT_568735 [Amniculicola lignicola CBS 123094]|uniref:Uncharacterized protein n=1 Tax=Amniculicola lignicola CBS 123094 TaxID=1392246 RepID=A0A6A5X4Z4_9PLEO|nr:hypothetical protein P154DRAFT_568735 [Amniculicola lignicola CBS 123094]